MEWWEGAGVLVLSLWGLFWALAVLAKFVLSVGCAQSEHNWRRGQKCKHCARFKVDEP